MRKYICLLIFISAASCADGPSEHRPDPIETYLISVMHSRQSDGAESDCPLNVFESAEIISGQPITGIVKEKDLCLYYIHGDSLQRKIRLISLSGDSDLALSYSGMNPGNNNYGFRKCSEEGWEICSVNSGIEWEEILQTTPAGSTRYIGIHGYYCPSGECHFKLEITGSGDL